MPDSTSIPYLTYKLGRVGDGFDLQLTTEPTAVPAHDDAASQLGASMGFSPDTFDFTTKPTDQTTDMRPWTVTHASTSGDTLDFKPELTTEPTTSEAQIIARATGVTGNDIVPQENAIDRLAVDPNNPNAGPPGQAHMAISLGDGKAIEAAGDKYGIGEWGDGTTDPLGDPITFTYTVTNPTSGDTFEFKPQFTPKVPGALLFSFDREPTAQAQTDDGLLLPAVQTDHAVTWTAIAMAESGGNTGAHNPHGEDSRGLWQINVGPAQTNNPDTFDSSELVQWASGNTGAHNPHGEDSRGLWQINVGPAQTNNRDTFDCSELVQWASEPVELLGQPTVATEALTIPHEGFWL